MLPICMKLASVTEIYSMNYSQEGDNQENIGHGKSRHSNIMSGPHVSLSGPLLIHDSLMDGVNSCAASVIDSMFLLWCRIQASASADKTLKQAVV